jgi:GTP cyclohydrolase I
VIDPRGTAVHLQAAHLCTQICAVNEHTSHTTTTFWRGTYNRDPHLRHEFLNQIRDRG